MRQQEGCIRAEDTYLFIFWISINKYLRQTASVRVALDLIIDFKVNHN